jgi:hypothetical protein
MVLVPVRMLTVLPLTALEPALIIVAPVAASALIQELAPVLFLLIAMWELAVMVIAPQLLA